MRNVSLKLIALVLVWVTVKPVEAGPLRRLFGGLFGGGRRARVIGGQRAFRRQFFNPFDVGFNRFAFNPFNPFDPFGHGFGSFGDPRFFGGGLGLDPFNPLDPSFNGAGGNNALACQQVSFEQCGGDFKPWACTAQLANGRILDISGSNRCDTLKNLKLAACRRGADPTALDNWNPTCRKTSNNSVARLGDFSGDFASGQIVIGFAEERDVEATTGWLQGKGVSTWHRFQGRRLVKVNVNPGEEASMCNALFAWDKQGRVRSCNPNIYVSNGGTAVVDTTAGAIGFGFGGY